jgi:hypothetical protein
MMVSEKKQVRKATGLDGFILFAAATAATVL